MADLTGPNPDEVQGPDARDAPLTAQPLLAGARASTATPTAVSADNDAVDLWASRSGALQVTIRDTAGAALPVMAVLADATANPTTTGEAAFLMGWNGTTWDRVRTANTGRLQVDVIGPGDAGDGLGAGNTFKTAGYILNGTGAWDRIRAANADAMAATGLTAVGSMVYNGTTWDRVVGSQGVAAGTNTDRGVLAAGIGPGFARIPATQSITGVSSWNIPTAGASLVLLSFTGTYTGWSANIKGLADSVPVANTILRVWSVTSGTYISGSAFVSATAANGVYIVDVRGYRTIQVATTAVGSGTVVGEATVQAVGGQGTDAFLMGYTGTVWEAVKTASGRLQVDVVTGAQQYTEDAALGAVGAGIGPLGIARASASAPTSVSADADAVGLWASRFGALNVILRDTAGAALGTAAAALSDTFANPTIGGIQTFGMLYDTADNDWDRARAVSGDAQTNEGITAAGLTGYNGTTYDRARLIAALDAAPNVDTGILAIGQGPGWDRKRDPAGVAATSTANAVTVVVDGADVLAFHVTTIGVTPGSMIIEQTTDDTNWATAGAVMKLGAETWVQGSFVPAVNDVYLVRTTGIRQVRYRVNAVYASGTATVKVTGSVGAAMLKTIDVAPAPHNIGFPIVGKTAQFTTTQTGVALWTPASGKRIVVTAYQIQVGGTTAGTAQVWFGASGDTAYTRGTDSAIFDGEFAPSATSKPGVVQTGVWVADAVDRILRLTTSAAINPITVTVWGYETV